MVPGLLSVSSAGSATAASACTFQVQLPTEIVLTQTQQTWAAPLAINCPAAVSCSLKVELNGPQLGADAPADLTLTYSTWQPTVYFGLSGCNPLYENGQAGLYTASLLSAQVTDANGQPVDGVQLLPSAMQADSIQYAYSASSRRGSAVYINGLFKYYGGAVFVESSTGFPHVVCGLERRRVTTVYLQRYLSTGWQTMLARTTDVNGQVAVGFVQPVVRQLPLGNVCAPDLQRLHFPW